MQPMMKPIIPPIIFATYTATHTGEGGPVPPTNKTTNSHYVYTMKMNGEGQDRKHDQNLECAVGHARTWLGVNNKFYEIKLGGLNE